MLELSGRSIDHPPIVVPVSGMPTHSPMPAPVAVPVDTELGAVGVTAALVRVTALLLSKKGRTQTSL
jgi:hypothetical protein